MTIIHHTGGNFSGWPGYIPLFYLAMIYLPIFLSIYPFALVTWLSWWPTTTTRRTRCSSSSPTIPRLASRPSRHIVQGEQHTHKKTFMHCLNCDIGMYYFCNMINLELVFLQIRHTSFRKDIHALFLFIVLLEY